MKSKIKAFLISFILASLPFQALATETPRPIFASYLTNGTGILWVPPTTPLGDRACYFDQNSTVAASVTTGEELAFVHGVTAPIQAQINAISGGGAALTNTVSGTFTVPSLLSNYILNVNTMGGNVAITLPSAAASGGYCLDVKNIGTNTVTDTAPLSQTIDGASSKTITDLNDSDHYCAVGGNWFVY